MGFLRADVEPGHPQFGKPVRCQNPTHFTKEISRFSSLSTLHQDDLKLRLTDITVSRGEKESNEKMIEACQKMIRRPYGWLYIWGTTGNAKTVALKAICNHLALKGYGPVVYIKFSRMLNIMREAVSEKKSRQKHLEEKGNLNEWAGLGYLDMFERLKKIQVLAIEEFDKASISEFAQEFRFDFLDERYEQGWRGEAITLFAGNSDPDELPMALRSRINDGRFMVVENTAGDSRPTLERTEEAPVVKPNGLHL